MFILRYWLLCTVEMKGKIILTVERTSLVHTNASALASQFDSVSSHTVHISSTIIQFIIIHLHQINTNIAPSISQNPGNLFFVQQVSNPVVSLNISIIVHVRH